MSYCMEELVSDCMIALLNRWFSWDGGLLDRWLSWDVDCWIDGSPGMVDCWTDGSPGMVDCWTDGSPGMVDCWTDGSPGMVDCWTDGSPGMVDCWTDGSPVMEDCWTYGSPGMVDCWTDGSTGMVDCWTDGFTGMLDRLLYWDVRLLGRWLCWDGDSWSSTWMVASLLTWVSAKSSHFGLNISGLMDGLQEVGLWASSFSRLVLSFPTLKKAWISNLLWCLVSNTRTVNSISVAVATCWWMWDQPSMEWSPLCTRNV